MTSQLATWRVLACAAALMSAGAGVALPAAALVLLEEDIRQVAEERRAFGLDADLPLVRELMNRNDPRIEGWPGLVVTPTEVGALDLDGRSRFVASLATVREGLEALPGFAGAWFDQANGGRLVIALTERRPELKSRIDEMVPRNGPGYEIRVADRSLGQLNRALSRLDSSLTELGIARHVVSASISQASNAIDIGIEPEAFKSVAAVADMVAERIGARVRVRAEKPGRDLACSDRNDCANFQAGVIIRNGSATSGKLCTSAFLLSVPGGATPYQFLTAGHCSHNSDGSDAPNGWWHGGSKVGNQVTAGLYQPGGIDIMRVGIDAGRILHG